MKVLLGSIDYSMRLTFDPFLLRYILSLLSLRGVVLVLVFISHLSKGMGTGVEVPHGRSVCRMWATFQAYSDDSPLRVELV